MAQGKVTPPDYRDILADLIEGKFPTRVAFCRRFRMDPGHLSRVLSGKSQISILTLYRILREVGMTLVARPIASRGVDVESEIERILDARVGHLSVEETAGTDRSPQAGR